MSRKNKNQRQCISCKTFQEKENLIRITKDYKDGIVKLNQASSYQGRSVYICKKQECLENAVKKKKIEYLLKVKFPESIKEDLYTVLNK